MKNKSFEKQTQKNVDFKALFSQILNRWYMYISIILACLIICVIYTNAASSPKYKSSGKLYIMSWESENLTTSQISISSQLANDFINIISDEIIIGEVAKELNDKYTVNEIKSFIEINSSSTSAAYSRIIEIAAVSPKAEDSKKIVDSISTISQKKFIEIMGTDCVKIIREGTLDKTPIKPSMLKNLMVFGFLGVLISLALASVLYLMNNTISSSEDVEKYLELTVLATIPYNTPKQIK